MPRESVTIVELQQPRCSLRFGVGACTATGVPKCYNTWSSCKVRNLYDGLGSIRWRFIKDKPGNWPVGDFSSANSLATNAIPVPGLDVSVAAGSLNAAGILDGKSPAGVRSRVTVTMGDFPWNDAFGDFYLADRTGLPARNFWACWMARNMFWGGMYLRIYDGYAGDSLAAMRQRVFVLDNVSGPDGNGKVTLSGLDPLMLATQRKSKFPEDMDVRLTAAITAVQTTIRVTTAETAKLTKQYGNLTGIYHMKIGNEVFSYTGTTLIDTGVYDLTGCVRGVVGTAATAALDTRCQRVGRYVDMPTWEIAYDQLVNHTPLPAAYVDHIDWADEGDTYLPTLRSTAWVLEPTLVDDLLGELCQQGQFYFWWDEYAITTRMQAVRPPRGTVTTLESAGNIVARSAELTREPDSLITRAFVYYGLSDPFKSSEPGAYLVVNGRIEGDVEHPNAAGGAKPLSILARWVNTEAHAVQIIQRILSRYATVPRFLTLRLDAKDRTITVGDVCDVTTKEIVDTEGRLQSDRWQVISWKEVQPGEVYLIDLQTYDYVGSFAYWMADTANDWASATDDEKLIGAWWADDDGKYPDGTPGYQWN